MIYELRNHWFIGKMGGKIELTNREHQLLTSLVYGQVVTYEELIKRIFGYDPDKFTMAQLSVLKNQLQKKIPINIETVRYEGYKLKTEILYE